jgi:hypothetical protein
MTPHATSPLAAAALALALGGCGKPALLNDVAPKKPHAHAAQAKRAQRAAQRLETSRQFMKIALNALLVPLLDDDSPPRWADPTLSYDCEALDVQVDEGRLDVGAPVHDGGFTVRWHMERCTPFDDTVELTGDIELKVQPIGGGYRVDLQPTQLHVVSAQGHEVLTEPFTARMSLGR